MNKSFMTNAIALVVFVIAYLLPEYAWRRYVVEASLFALSGAFTNWLAVYMLFEKIPGIYGSGIVPNRFQEFKKAIRSLIMTRFFTRENFDKYVQLSLRKHLDMNEILDKLFDELLSSVEHSPVGAMLAMIGKKSAFNSWRNPFKTKVTKFLDDAGILQKLTADDAFDRLKPQIEAIVDSKLEELTPEKVKEIIQTMIHKHLGWLVVWGGVFGAIMGLLCSVLL